MRWRTVIPFLLILLIISIPTVSAGFPPIPITMKTPSELSAYEDQEFLDAADIAITRITDAGNLPSGMEQSRADAAFMTLIKKNISPDIYPLAVNLTSFLYYVSEAGDAYDDYESEHDSFTSKTRGEEYYQRSNEYYEAASQIWRRIRDRYPEAEMFEMKGRIEESDTHSVSTGGSLNPQI